MPYQFRAQPGQMLRRADGSVERVFIPGTIHDAALEAGGEPPKYVEIYIHRPELDLLPPESQPAARQEALSALIESKAREFHSRWAAEVAARASAQAPPVPEDLSIEAVAAILGGSAYIEAQTQEEAGGQAPSSPSSSAQMDSQLIALGIKEEPPGGAPGGEGGGDALGGGEGGGQGAPASGEG